MNLNAVGRNITAIREARGWSQSELARRAGFSNISISNYEKKGAMTLERACILAETLGCTVADLTDDALDANAFKLDLLISQYYPYNLALAMLGCHIYKGVSPEATEDFLKEHKEQFYQIYIPGLLEALDDLTEREKRVLELRFRHNLDLEKTGKEFGVTRERIRQVEAKALRKLRVRQKLWKMIPMREMNKVVVEKDGLILKNQILQDHLSKLMERQGKSQQEIKEAVKGEPKKRISIDDMDLSVRSYNCLKRAGLDFTDQLEEKTYREMMRVRNLGKKSLEEVKRKMEELGLGFKEEDV